MRPAQREHPEAPDARPPFEIADREPGVGAKSERGEQVMLRRWWHGPFDVEQLARIAVHRVRDAAAELAAARELGTRVETTDELIAASFAAIEHLRIEGRAPQPWGGVLRVRRGTRRLGAPARELPPPCRGAPFRARCR